MHSLNLAKRILFQERGISAIGELSQARNAKIPTSARSLGKRLNPTGKRMPGSSSPDWKPDLLNEDQETTRPQRGAMNSTSGPQVIACEQKQKNIRSDRCVGRFPVNQSNGPACDCRDQEPHGRDIDNSFVRGGIRAGAVREPYQRRENKHIP